MDILVIILQLLLSLSLLVITHEGGHFLFAKLFGIRVEKFYLFFDPYFSLFKFKKGDTEYGIGWVPLGGYVKIAGMVDESMDTEQLKQPVQDWEFRAKPAWQRLLVMIGGVLVNLITAPIIFWFMLFTWGDTYVPNSQARYGIDFNDALIEAGFQDGDILFGVNGVQKEKLKDVANAIIYDDAPTINVLRNGVNVDIALPHEFYRNILRGNGDPLFTYRSPAVIDSVLPNSPAANASLAKGDTIIAVDSLSNLSFHRLSQYISSHKQQQISLLVSRASGSIDTLSVTPSDEGTIGFYAVSPYNFILPTTVSYGFFEALPAGISKGYNTLVSYVRQLPMIFTKEGATKVGGFGTMAKMFSSTWNWESFWFNTAFLAIILAVMNILPIPALDGGHVLFLIIEIITGKKASDKVLEVAQTIGMLLLLALVIYANGADIVRAFTD